MASTSPDASLTMVSRWALAWPELGLALPLDHLLDADPPGDHRQVGRQRADALVTPEDVVVVVDDLKQDLGGDILHVGLRDGPAPGMGHVLDHVVDQAQIAIDEIVPGPGFLPKTPVDELTINVAQGHGDASSRERALEVGDDIGTSNDARLTLNCSISGSLGNLPRTGFRSADRNFPQTRKDR